MSGSDGPGGIDPDLFTSIVEYTKERRRSSRPPSSDEDPPVEELLDRDHPLVAFCEDFTAELSHEYLTQPIDGLNSSSRRQLTGERRRLQRRNRSPELQKVLFKLESIALEITSAKYTRGQDETEEFVRDTFPDLLESVVAWLASTDDGPASDAATSALDELNHHLGRVPPND